MPAFVAVNVFNVVDTDNVVKLFGITLPHEVIGGETELLFVLYVEI